MTRQFCSLAIITAISLLSTASDDPAPRQRLEGETAWLRIVVEGSHVGGATTQIASASCPMDIDSPCKIGYGHGELGTEGELLNASRNGGIGGGNIDEKSYVGENSAFFWSFEGRLVDRLAAPLTLRLEWKRHRRGSEGEWIVEDERSETLALDQAETRAVAFRDFGTLPTEIRGSFENVVFTAAAEIREDPRMVDLRFESELWLLVGSDGDDLRRERLRIESAQGEEVSFAFDEQRWLTEREGTPFGRPFDAWARHSGTLRLRQRRDGSIMATLNIDRSLGFVDAGQPIHGSVGSGGGRQFRIDPEETVRFVLPPSGGYVGASQPPIPGGEVTKDTHFEYLDCRTFSKAHPSVILLVVRPLEDETNR